MYYEHDMIECDHIEFNGISWLVIRSRPMQVMRYTPVIEMDANRANYVWGHNVVGYGKAIALHKYPWTSYV